MTDNKFRDARDLVRGRDRAALATALPGADGDAAEIWPYASLVLTAVDHDLSPILLLSNLAEHSRAIAADNRVSLLFDGTAGLDQPLAGPRITLVGRANRTDDGRLARRYLAHHPEAEMYVGFSDFAFYRVALERAHLIGGFGKIHWLTVPELTGGAAPAGLADAEQDVIAHMNCDHADALQLYATKLLQLDGRDWRMIGIDAEGIDLRQGGQTARLAFDEPLASVAEARKALVALAARARAA